MAPCSRVTKYTLLIDIFHSLVVQVNFTMVCDTQTPNKSVNNFTSDAYWNFNYNETHSKEVWFLSRCKSRDCHVTLSSITIMQFLEAVAVRIQNSDRSINYWVTER